MYEPLPPPLTPWLGLPLPPPVEPPARRSRRESPWFWFIVTGAVVIVATAGGSGIALAEHSGSVRTTSAKASPNTPSAEAAKWKATVAADSQTLGTDFMTFAADGTAEDEPAVSSDCTAILADIAGFQSDISGPPPAGDAQVNSLLVRALQTYDDACTAIVTSIATQDASGLDAAFADIDTGNTLMGQALALIHPSGSPILQ